VVRFLVLVITCSFFSAGVCSESHLRDQGGIFHLNVGIEHGLTVLGTLRLGRGSWEAGLLNTNMNGAFYGVAKNFNLTKTFYAGFGLGAVDNKLGFFSALGAEFLAFSIFQLRAELNGSTSYDNYSNGGFIFGINCIL
jgi:hypothetical protein